MRSFLTTIITAAAVSCTFTNAQDGERYASKTLSTGPKIETDHPSVLK